MSIDSLTSPTLKHLRERWWNPEFSEFLSETLRPRPGTRILDVGCGEGTAVLSLGRLQMQRHARDDHVRLEQQQAFEVQGGLTVEQ